MINFKINEFDSPDKKGSSTNMCPTFLSMIDKARSIADVPFIITSGYRTKSHNKSVGGVLNSSHTKGLACDIKCTNSSHRFLIISALRDVGFTRIGISKTFIHCDSDVEKSQNVYWVY